MTSHPCTCDEFADRLADYLERDVDETTRAAMESHALGCPHCGMLLADLRELSTTAAALPDLVPPRDLWSGIAERIAAPVVPLDARGIVATALGRRRLAPPRWVAPSAAAAALILISVGGTYLAMRDRGGAGSPQVIASVTKPVTVPEPEAADSPTAPQRGAGAPPASSSSPVNAAAPAPPARRSDLRLASNTRKPTAEETYDHEIATLRAVVAQRRSTLDTATVAVIEKNLAVIDSAIAQCRRALARDPGSAFLLQSLNGTLETKIELLRTAAMLPAHT